MTKGELLQALRETREEVLSRLPAVSDASLAEGRYENGWNGMQILAHMASIEWTYPRLLGLVANPESTAPPPPPVGGSTVREQAAGTPQILDYNERQVAKRADASRQDLVAEFAKNRDALIAAVQGADDEVLQRLVTSAGGARGPLADVIHFVAVQHVRLHLGDIIGPA
jgi:hypothetical protein